MAAGVFLGALVLGLLLLAYRQGQTRTITAGADTRAQATETPLRDAAVQPPVVASRQAAMAQLPKLPGLIEANRLQLKTACIAGTIGHRQRNGWTQAVDKRVPRRCVATSE